MKKKNKITFPMGLIIYIMALLLLFLILLCALWMYAEQYEITLPTDVMDRYVASIDRDKLREKAMSALEGVRHEFQTNEQCADVIVSSLNEPVTYSRSGGNGEDDIVYSIRCGSVSIGSVRLVPDFSSNSMFSMIPWKMVSEDYTFSVEYTPVSVTVPDDYTVTVNGITLDASYITQSGVQYERFKDYYDSYGEAVPSLTEYTAEHCIGPVSIQVYDEVGTPIELQNLNDGVYRTLDAGDEYSRLSVFIDDFIYRYIYYTSAVYQNYEGGYYALKPYLLQGSDLQIRMRNAMDGLTWAYTSGFNIDNVTINAIYPFHDGWYLCDFTSTFTVIENGTSTNNYCVLVKDNDGDLRAADLNMY